MIAAREPYARSLRVPRVGPNRIPWAARSQVLLNLEQATKGGERMHGAAHISPNPWRGCAGR